jgi:hypothetical protein
MLLANLMAWPVAYYMVNQWLQSSRIGFLFSFVYSSSPVR